MSCTLFAVADTSDVMDVLLIAIMLVYLLLFF